MLELKLIIAAILLTIILISLYIVVGINQTSTSHTSSKPNTIKPFEMIQKPAQEHSLSSELIIDLKGNQHISEDKWHPPVRQPDLAPGQIGSDSRFQQQTPIKVTAGITPEQKRKALEYRKLKDLLTSDPLQKQQYEYYQKKYNISQYQQIPFCIVIPSFNNVKDQRIQSNFNSIRQQNYSNYRAIFINDASTDGTGQVAEKYLNKNNVFKQKVTIINNEVQKYALANILYAAKNFCKPEDVFVIVDGDDQLLGRQVLKLYSALFQKTKAYFVYTNFLSSRGSIGYSRPFRDDIKINSNYRKAPLLTSHLRAYYTALLQRINDHDLRDKDGHYFRAANDVALCIPILEMCHKKVQYFPQMTYLYNSATGLNNHMTKLREQKANDRYIRTQKRYAEVDLDNPSSEIYAQNPQVANQNQNIDQAKSKLEIANVENHQVKEPTQNKEQTEPKLMQKTQAKPKDFQEDVNIKVQVKQKNQAAKQQPASNQLNISLQQIAPIDQASKELQQNDKVQPKKAQEQETKQHSQEKEQQPTQLIDAQDYGKPPKSQILLGS